MDDMFDQADPRTRNARDAGLQRIKKLTRWSLAGALTGTGVFAGLAAHAGGTTTSAASKTASQSSATASTSRSRTSSSAGTSASSATTTPTTAATTTTV